MLLEFYLFTFVSHIPKTVTSAKLQTNFIFCLQGRTAAHTRQLSYRAHERVLFSYFITCSGNAALPSASIIYHTAHSSLPMHYSRAEREHPLPTSGTCNAQESRGEPAATQPLPALGPRPAMKPTGEAGTPLNNEEVILVTSSASHRPEEELHRNV